MTTEFGVGTYQIRTRDGQPKTGVVLKSADEVFDHVKGRLDPDIYHVFRMLSRDRPGTSETEFWGELTKHENGEVTYSPTSTEP
jgi:hypothetical protein